MPIDESVMGQETPQGNVENDSPPPQETVSNESKQIDFSGTKHKVKIEGKEEEWTYEDLLKNVSHSSAAARRMNEATQLKRKYEEAYGTLEKLAESDPVKFMNFFGINPAEYAKNQEQERVRQESLPPEEKLRMEQEKRLTPLEQQIKTLESKLSSMNQELVKRDYGELWNKYREKYPYADSRVVAARAMKEPAGREEDIFREEHEAFKANLQSEVNKLLQAKKNDAKKRFTGNSIVPSSIKDFDKMNIDQRAEAIKRMLGKNEEE